MTDPERVVSIHQFNPLGWIGWRSTSVGGAHSY
jgi:hypothetical protein